MNAPLNKLGDWRQSTTLIIIELVLIVFVYLADWKNHIFVSKIPYLLLIAWTSLWVRGYGWCNVGFNVYHSWNRTLTLGVAAGVGIELLELFCTQPLLARLTGEMPDLSAFARVAGNTKWLLISLLF